MLKSELIKKIENIVGNKGCEITVSNPYGKPGLIDIKFTRMYEYVEISFDHLVQFSELFGTRKINIGDRESWGGCETCDYGSSYEVTVHMNEVQLVLED
jgi:hypothetical protein